MEHAWKTFPGPWLSYGGTLLLIQEESCPVQETHGIIYLFGKNLKKKKIHQ